MNRSQTSLVGVISAASLIGLGCAALRYASDSWADGLFSLALLLIGVAILGSIYRRGERRAFWAGFAMFGTGYLVVSTAPWFDTEVAPHLATTVALEALHARFAFKPVVAPPGVTVVGNVVVTDSEGSEVGGAPKTIVNASSLASSGGPLTSDPAMFRRVGHAFFSIVAAGFGGLVARRIARKSAEPTRDIGAH
jgi:hypothetical protein